MEEEYHFPEVVPSSRVDENHDDAQSPVESHLHSPMDPEYEAYMRVSLPYPHDPRPDVMSLC